MTGARDLLAGRALATLLMLLVASGTASRPAAAEPPAGFALHDSPRPLPEIRFEVEAGKTLSLADFNGKVVLLNIWATWCAPCRREMPTLDHLQAELGGPDFQVVALSIDRQGLPAVAEFYREIGLETLPIYVDPSGASQRALRVLGIPTTLLLDRDGNELGRLAGPAEWDSPEMVGFIRGHVEQQSGLGRMPPKTCSSLARLRDRSAASRRMHDFGDALSFQSLEGPMYVVSKETAR